MTASSPASLRLDNAANIYPASMSKEYSSLYRMKVTLSHVVDVTLLQEALASVSERIPTFRCTLRAGAFWWYLDRCSATPVIRPLKPLKDFSFEEQNGLLYRVSARGCAIFLDVFHALADGNGALIFLMTLTGEYIRRRYGVEIPYNQLVLNPKDHPVYAEVEDSFKSVFSGRHGQLEQNVDAYHIKGTALPRRAVKDLRVVLSSARVKDLCREYSCTVTEFLTASMIWALQEVHRADPIRRKRSVLKVSVPVNLRPLYGSRTVRNFSSYVNLGVDVKDGYYSFDQLVKAIREQKAHDMQQELLESKIAANVALEEMLLVRMLPLKIKHPIIDLINLLHGDRFISQTLSNLGMIKVPEALYPYMKDVDFMLGCQRGNSGAVSCLGYNGKLYVHLTRKIVENEFETALLRLFYSLGLSADTSTENLA